jgi:hypothetical protein
MPTPVPTGEVSLRYECFTGEIRQVVLDLCGELPDRLVKDGREEPSCPNVLVDQLADRCSSS